MKRHFTLLSVVAKNYAMSTAKLVVLTVLFCCAGNAAFAAATVTPATGGTTLCSNLAVDGSAPALTTLGPIVIAEGLVTDFANNGGNWTINMTLNAPTGWNFNVSTVAYAHTTISGSDVTTVATQFSTATTMTVRISGNGRANLDTITITGLQVQAQTTASAPGSIYASIAFGSSINGVTLNSGGTNFGDLSQTPTAISGARAVCVGSTTTLSDASAGGTWGSSNTNLATVTSGGGAVTGVSAGVVRIDYTLGGCITTFSMTVNTAPGAISGTLVACAGIATTLSNPVTGGAWTSGTTSVATVTGTTGIVTGVSTITTQSVSVISYTISGCTPAQATFTVNPLPASISGTTIVCVGLTTTLSSSPAGGQWSSATTTVATIAPGGFTATGVSGGTSVISYLLPTGCVRTTNLTVNTPPTISGASAICSGTNTTLSSGTPTSGAWTSSNTNVATITTGGVVNGVPTVVVPSTTTITYSVVTCPASTRTFTVNPTPANIVGTASACVNATSQLSDATASGAWSSSNTNQATVVGGLVTGVASGNPVISYTVGSCSAVRTFTVNAIPATITGTTTACTGNTARLSDTSPGGTWSSSNSTVATIAPGGNGTVFATTAGNAVISYRFNTGCQRTVTVTVNQSPAAVTGTNNVCENLVTNLSDATPGGTWSSSNTNFATVDVNGAVTGVSPGNVVITYHDGTNACTATASVTINATPSSIIGSSTVCEASTTQLSNTSPGGNWSSDNTTVATIDPVSGVVSGVSGGTANITYDFGAACSAMTTITVDPLPTISPIAGSTQVCLNGTTQLSDATASGVWSSSDNLTATVSNTGLVTGVAAGPVDIYYTVANSCGSQFATITMSVDNLTPDVSITTSVPGFITCEGVPVTFTANPVNGGSSPVYEWKVNGSISSVTGTLVYTPANGDEVIVKVTSNAACLAVPTGSDTALLVVDPNLTPSVHITSSLYGDTVCVGTNTPFTAVPVNGGTTPSYSWLVNGTPVGAGNPFNYTPGNGDLVSVELTSSYHCAVPATVVSNTVTMTVDVTQTPAITITPSANPSCEGSPVTYTAHTLYGGLSPFIRWSQNSINVATGPTYTIVPANGDQFYAVLMSSSVCRTNDSIFSNTVFEVVDTAVVPVVNIVTNHTTITVGQNDTLIALVTPLGLTPTYQWYLNGVAIPSATQGYYVVTGTVSGVSYYYCIVGNGNACNTTGVSNLVTINTYNVGVNDITAGSFDLKLVPNPNGGTFSVEGAVPANSGSVTLEVTNMIGQVVYKQNAQVQNDKMSQQVSLGNDLANGVYMLHVITNNEHKVIRFSLSR